MVDKISFTQALSEELILDLTSRMVAIPSRNPPGEERACAEFIFNTLQSWGVETELVAAPDPNRPQVVAWLRGTGNGPTLILNGHIDTVTEGDRSAWQSPPFEATLRGKRLYGLGTCDMKGSLAAGMVILKTLHESSLTLPGTLMLQAATGEEMSEDGTRTLLQLGYRGDCAIVLEPTDLRIAPATRGAVWYKVTLLGQSVQCGLAEPNESDLMAQFARVGISLATYHRQISTQNHALLPPPACRITQVRAGERHNHLAARCEFIIDRRMLPQETFAQVAGEIREVLAGTQADHGGFDYQMTYMRGDEPAEIPLDSPLVDVLKRNIEEIQGDEPQTWGAPYGSDVRNFVCDAGIPAVNYGAGDYRVCHQPNEFVPIDGLMTCARVVMGATIDLLAGLPEDGA